MYIEWLNKRMHFLPAMSQGIFPVHLERCDFLGVEIPHYR